MEHAATGRKNGGTVFLTEHLKHFSAARVPSDTAGEVIEEALREYGPVRVLPFASFQEARSFLMPIKSFTTRFLLLGTGRWTFVASNMRYENCISDAYLLSRKQLCDAIMVAAESNRREFATFTRGKLTRQVECILDYDRWTFLQEGAIQPFEDPAEYKRPRKSDRLSVRAVQEYFTRFTGLAFPDWGNMSFTNLIGLERSTSELLVPVVSFDTVDDLS